MNDLLGVRADAAISSVAGDTDAADLTDHVWTIQELLVSDATLSTH
jgi:hypothetical protein